MKIDKLLFFLVLVSTKVIGQKTALPAAEAILQKAIAQAYPASVRMWGIDTVSNQQMSAQFSGVVVSREGEILTAAHTTVPGKTYKVMFPDGKEAVALALGKIELTDDITVPDVSMMKIITAGTWPFTEMGYSSALKVGQPCISIAYPESLNQPLPGIRFGYITNVKNEKGFVQSTCIMEPGDSGGPLFDLLGRVIGIHSAISISEDVNYEIPVDLYRKYHTALQVPEKYSSMPEPVDAVANDPQPALIPVDPQPAALRTRFNAVETRLSGSCLQIISQLKDKEATVFGTVFTSIKKGDQRILVVSKSSLVGNTPVILYQHKKVALAVLYRDRENDLVLLQAKESIKDAIVPDQENATPFKLSGQFLFSPRVDTVGAISIAGSGLFSVPKTVSMGFLGASVPYRKGPVQLSLVRKNSPAGNNDLQEGDEVVSINGIAINKPENYGAELQKYWPGDTIAISLKRAGNTYTKQVVLVERPAMAAANHPAEMFRGGKSTRRDGFTAVFAHDAVLTPDQCGGPVFDAAGHFQGINIARFSRTSTLVLPASVVVKFLRSALK
jgi:serine protease Do